MTSPAGFTSRLFWSGALGFVVIGALPSLYGLALPGFAQRFGLGQGGGGLLLSVHGLGAFASVVAGLAGAGFLTLRLGLICISLGAALLALELNWPLMLLGALGCGLGFGVLSVVVNRAFLSSFGDRGPGMVAFVNSIFGVGAIAAPSLFVWAGGASALVFGGLALSALAIVPLALVPANGPVEQTGLPNLRQWPVLIVTFMFFCAFLEVGLLGFGPTVLQEAGMDPLYVAGLTAAFSVCYLLGRLSLFWLTRVWPSDLLFLAGLAGTFLASLVAGGLSASAGFVLSGAFTAMLFPTFYVWVIDVLRDARMGSAVLCAGLGAAAICPLVFGLLLGAFGAQAFFPILAVIAGAMTLACLPTLLWARRRQA